MNNSYSAPWRKLAFAAFLAASATTAQGQDLLRTRRPITSTAFDLSQATQPATANRTTASDYTASQAQNVAGTYTDLGTSGTAISTTSLDDASSAAQNIGFAFSYNGTSFTQFVLNTNGFIKLGAAAPTAANDFDVLLNSTDANVIAPASGVDLQGAADQTANPTDFRVSTTGTTGSRVCTIQFKNLRDKASTYGTTVVQPHFATMQFQIKLYEGTNTIEFVYGTWTATAGTVANYKLFRVGLKANTLPTPITLASLSELSLVDKGNNDAWSAAVFANTYTQNGQIYISSFDAGNSVLPDAGRTYRFRVVPATDAAVQYIYAMGKTQPGTTQVVRAVVRNLGSSALTNLAVALNVTGANTFVNAATIPSLAVGASTIVTFPSFTPATVGTNTITVSVPADGGTSNDTQTYSQQVQTTIFAQYNPALTTGAGSVGFGTSAGIIAVKFNSATTRTINSVAVRIGNATSVGNTVYGVILDANGAIAGRSADYTVATADIGTLKSFTLTTPAVLTAGDFYAGLAQTANATTGYFPIAVQAEAPTRTGVVYATALAGGTPADVTTAAANANIGLPIIEAVASGVQGTSAALNRAVSMYPNPSTGVVKLDVRGANAKGNLNVQVINVLGQTVYSSSLKDNFTNEVNLSSLANGIYTLKVQTGSEFTSRQLVLSK